MAFIGLKVPHETARLLGQVKVEGEKVDLSEMHVTMIYLGSEVPIETIAKATTVAFEVTSQSRPFTLGTELVTSFPKNPDGIPIIARVRSEELHALRQALTVAFDKAGVSYDKKYPEYKPHVTLAYLHGAKEAPPDQKIPPLEWGAGELVLWGGDHGDDKLTVIFPFALAPSKSAAYRALVRLAKAGSARAEDLATNRLGLSRE